MKFLRQLSAVVLVVAVIVGLGMLWEHASGSGTDPGGGFQPAGFQPAGFQLAQSADLIRTCLIEAALAAVVITVSAIRRWHRRTRRT